MVRAGNKTKPFLLVSLSAETIHHHKEGEREREREVFPLVNQRIYNPGSLDCCND